MPVAGGDRGEQVAVAIAADMIRIETVTPARCAGDTGLTS